MGKIKQNNIDITKVIFRKFKDGEVIALFPELPGSMSLSHCQSYMHIGQHGTSSTSIYYDTKPVKPIDYMCLKTELWSLGYRVKVVSRFSYQMDQKRSAAIRG